MLLSEFAGLFQCASKLAGSLARLSEVSEIYLTSLHITPELINIYDILVTLIICRLTEGLQCGDQRTFQLLST